MTQSDAPKVIDSTSEIQQIPQWVIEYNNAGYTSGAGKAVKILINVISDHEFERSKHLSEINSLRDQLSKERTTIKSLNQEITNLQITGSLLVDNDDEADLANKLHSVNVTLHKELEISENLRKSVSAMRIVLEWLINSEGFQRSFPLKTTEIKSILAKASELDKNKT